MHLEESKLKKLDINTKKLFDASSLRNKNWNLKITENLSEGQHFIRCEPSHTKSLDSLCQNSDVREMWQPCEISDLITRFGFIKDKYDFISLAHKLF